jgi:uncharacterized membrane protein
MNNEEWDLESILKRFALWGGIALALISIYFSYDGADQTITGGNPAYSEIAKIIMWVMAVVVTLAQFIFNSDFTKLSTTMRVIGVASYVYSLTTNYMGIQHLFGFSGFIGGMIAAFMDIAPEAFIAWSLDDAMRGDMLGNLGKFALGGGKRSNKKVYNAETKRPTHNAEPGTQPKMPAAHFQHGNNHGQGKTRRQMLENKYQQKGKGQGDAPNRFDLFGE